MYSHLFGDFASNRLLSSTQAHRLLRFCSKDSAERREIATGGSPRGGVKAAKDFQQTVKGTIPEMVAQCTRSGSFRILGGSGRRWQ
jgi:hypothetical protein